MRDEYDIKELNPRRNPYVNCLKTQITIYMENEVLEYYKGESERLGIPCQKLINLYLTDCAKNKMQLCMEWKEAEE